MRTAFITAALLLTAISVGVPPAAATEDVRGLARYSCTTEGGLGQGTTSVALTLARVPDTLEAGQVLRLSGELDLIFPPETATQAQLELASESRLKDTDFHLQAVLGERRFRIEPHRVTSEAEPISSPYIRTATIEFRPFKLPRGASGELVLAMPEAGRTQDPTSVALEPAVFRTVVAQNSPLIQEREFDCSLFEEDKPGAFTRIPITAEGRKGDTTTGSPPADSGTPTSTGGSGTPPEASAPAPDQASVGAPAAGDPPAVEPGAPGAESGQVPAESAQVATVSSPTSAAVPPTTQRPGTFIPVWTLLLMMTTLAGLSAAYAVRRRMALASLTRTGTAVLPDATEDSAARTLRGDN